MKTKTTRPKPTDPQIIYLQQIKPYPPDPRYGCDAEGNVYTFRFKLANGEPRVHRMVPCPAGGTPDQCKAAGKPGGLYHRNRLNNKQIYVHKIIAETWLPDWKPGLIVDHIMCNQKTNNWVSNLRVLNTWENGQNTAGLGISYRKKDAIWQTSVTERLGDSKTVVSEHRFSNKSFEAVLLHRIECVQRYWKYNWINDMTRDLQQTNDPGKNLAAVFACLDKLQNGGYNFDLSNLEIHAQVPASSPPRPRKERSDKGIKKGPRAAPAKPRKSRINSGITRTPYISPQPTTATPLSIAQQAQGSDLLSLLIKEGCLEEAFTILI